MQTVESVGEGTDFLRKYKTLKNIENVEMLSEIPCLFCFSAATTSEEYPDESVRSEAERIYKLLCSVLGVNLKRNEDIFYLLCTKSFLPLCKTCSRLFRTFSELATTAAEEAHCSKRSLRDDTTGSQKRLSHVAEDIRATVRNSEGHSSQSAGTLGTESGNEIGIWCKWIRKFRQSVAQGDLPSEVSESLLTAPIQLETILLEDFRVKEEIAEEVEPFISVSGGEDVSVDFGEEDQFEESTATLNEKKLVLVDLEKIIKIKPEADDNQEENDEADILSSCGSRSGVGSVDEGNESNTDTSDSEDEEEADRSSDPDWREAGEFSLSEDDADESLGPTNKQTPGNGAVNFPCPKRKIRSWKIKNVRADSDTIIKSGGFECDQCNVAFAFEINLERHIQKYHTGRKTVNKASTSQPNKKLPEVPIPNTRLELLPKLEPEIFNCSKCKYTFATPSSLRRHNVRYHSGGNKTNKLKKPPKKRDDTEKRIRFKCSKCTENFTFKNNLNRHIQRYHSGPLKKRKSLRDNRVRRPQQIISVNCDHCNTVFTNQVNLNRHVRRIHAGPRIQGIASSVKKKDPATKPKRVCRICGEVFLDSSNLNRHIKAVHFECRLFECPDCKRTFNRSDNLKMHQRRFHST